MYRNLFIIPLIIASTILCITIVQIECKPLAAEESEVREMHSDFNDASLVRNIRRGMLEMFTYFLARKEFKKAYEIQMLLEQMGDQDDLNDQEVSQEQRAKRRTFFVGK